MKPSCAPVAMAASSMPSITAKGSCSRMARSLKQPGSPSSALHTMVLGVPGASRTACHFRPVGNPAPPRPAKLLSVRVWMTKSGPRSQARRADAKPSPVSYPSKVFRPGSRMRSKTHSGSWAGLGAGNGDAGVGCMLPASTVSVWSPMRRGMGTSQRPAQGMALAESNCWISTSAPRKRQTGPAQTRGCVRRLSPWDR